MNEVSASYIKLKCINICTYYYIKYNFHFTELQLQDFMSECRKLLQIIPSDFLFFVLDDDNAQEARKILDGIKVDHRRLILLHQEKTAIYDKCYECLRANLSKLKKKIKEKGTAMENSEQHLIEIRRLLSRVDKRYINEHSKASSTLPEDCLERYVHPVFTILLTLLMYRSFSPLLYVSPICFPS